MGGGGWGVVRWGRVWGSGAGAELVHVESRLLNSLGPVVLHPTSSSCICHQTSRYFFVCFLYIDTLFYPLLFNLVAPPQDLQITDPGLLGPLDVEWKPPPNVQNFNECTVKYKFEYRNTGDRDWKVRQSMVPSS